MLCCTLLYNRFVPCIHTWLYPVGLRFPQDCELCKEGDVVCYQRNRESGGFLNFDESELKGL